MCSFVFYGYWNYHYCALLLGSALFNYAVGALLLRSQSPTRKTATLAFGILVDLGLLFFYKYFGPLAGFLSEHGILDGPFQTIILPLGISFFTFTQIAYLLDTAAGAASERNLLNYLLFVTYYPHLIAGPILHHREIMPQFADPKTYRLDGENMAVGGTMFVFGLFKKTFIADQVGDFVPLAYADSGGADLVASWAGVLAYAVQLYFDFSGYSDMAIGLARMFGVRFPLNFNSPYKATNIVDYWQRWHMTLTRWLTSYLYNPMMLAMLRRRQRRGGDISAAGLQTPRAFLAVSVLPLLVTMGLAGIWHGAGLQFLCFGLLHGCYMSVHRAWAMLRPRPKSTARRGWPSLLARPGPVLLTFACVLVAQVFFRADSVGAAVDVLAGLVGRHGVLLPATVLGDLGRLGTELVSLDLVSSGGGPSALSAFPSILAALGIAFLCPNSQEIMALTAASKLRPGPDAGGGLRWSPNPGWALGLAAMLFASLVLINNEQKFLYFQF